MIFAAPHLGLEVTTARARFFLKNNTITNYTYLKTGLTSWETQLNYSFVQKEAPFSLSFAHF
jgi:hypothetical protein